VKFDESLLDELDTLRTRLRALELRLGAVEREALPDTGFDVLLTESFGARLAFLLDQVRVVVPAAELAPLPEAPEWLLGLLTLRGRSIPVVDVATRLGAHDRKLDPSDLIVVTETEGRELAFVVQRVDGVTAVKRDSVESSVHETPHAHYVLGTFHSAGHSVLVIGISHLVGQLSELASTSVEAAAP
jgi:chemotaxis signal transduction protein